MHVACKLENLTGQLHLREYSGIACSHKSALSKLAQSIKIC